MFSKQPPEQWAEVMPRVVHVHGKSYGFGADADEPSVDHAALLRVFHDADYQSFVSGEWEGRA